GRRADVLLDPFGGTPRGLFGSGPVLADSDSEAPLAAPKSCVADEAGHPSDEVLDLVGPLLELIEELRSTLPGVGANDWVHHCLLETRRGDEHRIEQAAAAQICTVPGRYFSRTLRSSPLFGVSLRTHWRSPVLWARAD